MLTFKIYEWDIIWMYANVVCTLAIAWTYDKRNICSRSKYKDKENWCVAKCMKKDEEHAEELEGSFKNDVYEKYEFQFFLKRNPFLGV